MAVDVKMTLVFKYLHVKILKIIITFENLTPKKNKKSFRFKEIKILIKNDRISRN